MGDSGYPLVWLMIGAWFLIAGLPTFIFVKEKHQHEEMPPNQSLATIGFYRLARTLKEVQRFRQLFRFLLIFVLVYAGVMAVVAFASIIADETLKFNTTQLGIFLIVTNFVAVWGAWGWGMLQDKIGSIWAIRLSLLTWVVALILVMSIRPVPPGETVPHVGLVMFWIAGCFVGIGMGATSSSCRALVGLFSPQDRSGEFFGLWGMFGKLGTVIGPFSFGLVAKLARNDIRWAEASTGVYFILSFLLLSLVNEKEGRAAAVSTPAA
ncbi:MFS transporter [Candidatus Sumerlaeota bacterium]|nr:MFS transporter [Candidatus Sumerlaeota bacterium]